jgi:SpoVK/Ycf46/Vps4 family AAA+-type ATPase
MRAQQGGLDSAKKALQGAVMLPLLQPQMFGDGNRQVSFLFALCVLSVSFL